MTHTQLQAAGFDLSEAAYTRLSEFVRCLLRENQRVNLTAARDEESIWREHICDSLALLKPVAEERVRRLVDIGSGGGFPGMPLACVRDDLDVTLLDARRKKVEAVQRMIDELGLCNAQALCGRAETVAKDPEQRERYDAAVSRAVGPLSELIEYAAGFVHVGGVCWFFKSPAGVREEQSAAESAAQVCGMTFERSWRYRLPGDDQERFLVSYRKVCPLDPHLPRLPGRARKQPL